MLTDSLLPHGDIAPEVLLEWYRGRGKEQRFDHADLVELIATTTVDGRGLELISTTAFGQAPQTWMYTATAVDRRQDT